MYTSILYTLLPNNTVYHTKTYTNPLIVSVLPHFECLSHMLEVWIIHRKLCTFV